mmetsp:Transcript_25311/g.57548  ORF Transcript_25311/g.57548 Transcript_25311/m.57548 type:complete len:207 (+) Transcript_25311:54-674(+)
MRRLCTNHAQYLPLPFELPLYRFAAGGLGGLDDGPPLPFDLPTDLGGSSFSCQGRLPPLRPPLHGACPFTAFTAGGVEGAASPKSSASGSSAALISSAVAGLRSNEAALVPSRMLTQPTALSFPAMQRARSCPEEVSSVGCSVMSTISFGSNNLTTSMTSAASLAGKPFVRATVFSILDFVVQGCTCSAAAHVTQPSLPSTTARTL